MRTNKLLACIIVCIMLTGALPMTSSVVGAKTGSRDADNDFAHATSIISDDILIHSTLDGGNDPYDYYKIQLNNTAGSAEKLTINSTADCSGVCVMRMNVFDPDTYWIAYDLSLNVTSFLSVIAASSGWYYIEVEGQGQLFTYGLRFQKTSVAGTTNANVNAATAVTVSSFPTNITGSFKNSSTASADPQDFYKIHLDKVAGDHTDILMVKFIMPLAPAKACIELYYASNNTGIQGMFNGKGASFIYNPMGTIFTFAPKLTSDFLIRVWGYDGSGTYNLLIKKVTAHPDANNDKGTATQVLGTGKTHSDTGTGSVASSIDNNDYFKFNGKTKMHINATLDSQDYDKELNLPVIYLHLINSSDYEYSEAELDVIRMTADPQSVIEGDLPHNDTYYLWVESSGGAGNYQLNITANTPPQVVLTYLLSGFEMFIWENGTNTSLAMNKIFQDFDGDPMTYSAESNPNMDVTINPTTTVVTFKPKPSYKGPICENLTATDDHSAKGTVKVCAKVYGINHAPYIRKYLNETYPNDILVIKTSTVYKDLNLTQYYGDPDPTDKHWYSVIGNDKVYVKPWEETPVTPQHYNNGGLTIMAPNYEVTEFVQFYSKDNGYPYLTSPPLNLTIQVSTGEVRILASNPGEIRFIEDGSTTFPVNKYLYFKQPAPADDTIAYTAVEPTNLSVVITNGNATITPRPADWCGSQVIKFTGTGVKNTKATNSTSLKVVVTCVNDPPVIKETTPAIPGTGNLNVDEGGKLQFKAIATDPDTPMNMIKFRWYLDGALQASAINIFNYTPNFEMAGVHNISVTVNDTELQISYTWHNITVNNVNRNPTGVRILEPANNTNFTKGKLVAFRAGTATDPDKGDVVTYKWYDNGVQFGATQEVTTYKFKDKGTHTIKLEASDGHGGVTPVEIKLNIKETKKPGFIPFMDASLVVAAMVIVACAVVGVARRKK